MIGVRPAGPVAMRIALSSCLLALCACAPVRTPAPTPDMQPRHAAVRLDAPAEVLQGSLVMGRAWPGARVRLGERELRTAADGRFVFGIARDAAGALALEATSPDGAMRRHELTVRPREWPVEHVDGVPPSTVDPPPAIAARIRAEQARVTAARQRDDARTDVFAGFVRPVEGRISGRFGNQRVYNGRPGAPHSGMDIAAPAGTPVRAPAAGIVTLADMGLYLTGGTLLIDHGHGVSSNFLHLSRIDVRVGDRVEQGQAVAAVGATGRATGPHLHWGMNWLDIRVDPELVLRGSQ